MRGSKGVAGRSIVVVAFSIISGCGEHGGGDVNEGDDVQVAAQALGSRDRVKPVLECVTKVAPDQFYATFGYRSAHDEPVEILVGARNRFTPGPQRRIQPTTFQPGTRRSLFNLEFHDDRLVWQLDGEEAKATPSSRRCATGCNLPPGPGRVVGFETPCDWSTDAGRIFPSVTHSEGDASVRLTLRAERSAKLTSARIPTPAQIAETLGVDVMLPDAAARVGALEFFLSSRTLGLDRVRVGSAGLSGLAAGAFGAVVVNVPRSLQALLARPVDDLQFHLRLIHATPGDYHFDNLRFGPLIANVAVDKTRVCAGEDVRISTSLGTWSGVEPANISVTINGTNGGTQSLEFEGLGVRRVAVTARRADGRADARELVFEVVDCPGVVHPELAVGFNPYDSNRLDFVVANREALGLTTPRFDWSFGDGATLTTGFPAAGHVYKPPVDNEHPSFDVELVIRDGARELRTRKTVSIWNTYAFTRAGGVLQPPVRYDFGQSVTVDGDFAVATMSIENLETGPLVFTAQHLELQPCDSVLDPVLLPAEPIAFAVAGSESARFEARFRRQDVPQTVCSVAVHIVGSGVGGRVATASGYFGGRPAPGDRFLVTDPAWQGTIRRAFELLSTEEQPVERVNDAILRELELAGEIRRPPFVRETRIPLPPDPLADILGQPCEPGTAPPRPGVTCQAGTEMETVGRPRVVNALKGDLLLEAGCGFIGQGLRALTKPQVFSHEAMMTRNYDRLRHSTAAESRYNEHQDRSVVATSPSLVEVVVAAILPPPLGWLVAAEAVTDVRISIQEPFLRFGWPGTVTHEVGAGFHGENLLDPEGRNYRITAISAEAGAVRE